MILTDAWTRRKVLAVIRKLKKDHDQSKYISENVRTGYELALFDVKNVLSAELYVDPK